MISVANSSPIAQRIGGYLPELSVAAVWLTALFVLTWLSAQWFWRANAPAPVALPTQSVSDPLLAAQAIASRHLMGESQLAKPGIATQANSQFQLVGSMTASKGRKGFAVIAEDGKLPVSVVEGEELSPGITLSKVFPNKVEITRQGRIETIEINDKAIIRQGNSITVEQGSRTPENASLPTSPAATPAPYVH
jgi:general secretion pathway protein C